MQTQVSNTAKAVIIDRLNQLASNHREIMKAASMTVAHTAFDWLREQSFDFEVNLSFAFKGDSFSFDFFIPTTEPGMLNYSSIGVYFTGPRQHRAIPCPNSSRAGAVIRRMMDDADFWPGVMQAAELCAPECVPYLAYKAAAEELEKSFAE